MCTTHYTALKTLSQNNPKIENAAVEFDKETLNPTYRIHLGIPGASYAIDIARRLGMPEQITEKAGKLLGEQEVNLTELLSELEDTLRNVREQEKALTHQRQATDDLEHLLRERSGKLKKAEREFKSQALVESEKIINETKREMEHLVKEIRETQAEKSLVKQAHQQLAKKARETAQQIERLKETPPTPPAQVGGPIEKGDRVWVEAFQNEGEVVDVFPEQQKVKLRLGNLYYTLETVHCRRIDPQTPKAKEIKSASIQYHVTTEVDSEINLRGMSAEDAVEAVDRYLDEALLAGWEEVRIVHGKGEGILRRVINDMLGNDKQIVSRRVGDWNEGGLGVTVACLRKE